MERTMDDLDPANWTLSHGERLLIRTVRLLALGATCHSLKPNFEFACGCAGEEAYRALVVFVAQLRIAGRRRIEIGAPPTLTLTGDERTILAAFAAAQADDYRTLDTRLAGLTAAEPPVSLGAAVCLVAQVFAMQGLRLAVAEEDDAQQHRRPMGCRSRHHVAVPDSPGELQALVHIEDHAR
jgi:hypothetical protein